MTEHWLKIEVPFYWTLRHRLKTFEARKNDRGYEIGDRLCLTPWDKESQEHVREPGMEPLVFDVTHVQWIGMADGYVGLSLKPVGMLHPDDFLVPFPNKGGEP